MLDNIYSTKIFYLTSYKKYLVSNRKRQMDYLNELLGLNT